MCHADRECDIGARQRVRDSVAFQYREMHIGRRGTKIESDYLRAEFPANLLKKCPVRTPNIQHTPHRNGVAAKKPQNDRGVAQPFMGALKFLVGSRSLEFGDTGTIKNLGFGTTVQL
jgi:hypothetical protein